MIKPNDPVTSFSSAVQGDFLGLTVRAHFAALFTAAFISSIQNGDASDISGNAKIGVAQADALISELNKTQP